VSRPPGKTNKESGAGSMYARLAPNNLCHASVERGGEEGVRV
jgi:hypothetical protein